MGLSQPLNRPLTSTVNTISELTTVNTVNNWLKYRNLKGHGVIGDC
jgi:hypothetical protein